MTCAAERGSKDWPDRSHARARERRGRGGDGGQSEREMRDVRERSQGAQEGADEGGSSNVHIRREHRSERRLAGANIREGGRQLITL